MTVGLGYGARHLAQNDVVRGAFDAVALLRVRRCRQLSRVRSACAPPPTESRDPINPARFGGPAALRFRSAHHFGYGVSPEMAARCFERCDEEGITGDVEILYVLSDTHPEATQGPVWLLGGRTV